MNKQFISKQEISEWNVGKTNKKLNISKVSNN